MHSKGIVHRQLIPEKILLGTDSHIKLGNFSFASMKDRLQWVEEVNDKNCLYCPEIITQKVTSPRYELAL
jgi:serine/threonine protein kinase